jgi:hypothetical protein
VIPVPPGAPARTSIRSSTPRSAARRTIALDPQKAGQFVPYQQMRRRFDGVTPPIAPCEVAATHPPGEIREPQPAADGNEAV